MQMCACCRAGTLQSLQTRWKVPKLCAGVIAGKRAGSTQHVAAKNAADCRLATYDCHYNAATSALYGVLIATLAVRQRLDAAQ